MSAHGFYSENQNEILKGECQTNPESKICKEVKNEIAKETKRINPYSFYY